MKFGSNAWKKDWFKSLKMPEHYFQMQVVQVVQPGKWGKTAQVK